MANHPRTSIARRIGWACVARGASSGLTVLVLGGLAQPVVAHVLPPLGFVWLIVVALTAFVVAGARTRDAASPALHGTAAAVGSYLLVLPLVFLATGSLVGTQLLFTLATAVVVGAGSGCVASRMAVTRD